MVKALHRAGIEVILDVVYNHTAEGNHLGPTSRSRASTTRPTTGSSRASRATTSTTRAPATRSTRVHPSGAARSSWTRSGTGSDEMHVDGFRFDLASALARELHEVDQLSASSTSSIRIPVLSQVKLIAEPWDVGEGGYQVGNFPVLWAEWNGDYRDTMRGFWRGESAAASSRSRFTGSSDLYQHDGRKPSRQHQLHHRARRLHAERSRQLRREAQRRERRRRTRTAATTTVSWNCGVEGPTDDPGDQRAPRAAAAQPARDAASCPRACRCCSRGDEIGRTQHGNNNAYCQDNELSWIDWGLDERGERQLAFTRRLIELRSTHPVFHRAAFLSRRGERLLARARRTCGGSGPTAAR